MKRIPQKARPDWPQRLENIGFHFHSLDEFDQPPLHPDPKKFLYWREDVAYAFTSQEVETLYQAGLELHHLCMQAVECVIRQDWFERMGIDSTMAQLIKNSWESDAATLFGRFDLTLDEHGTPKMYEYNADTPTSLIESSIAQWFWKADVHPQCDQFNSLHEALIERWKALRAHYSHVHLLHLACLFESQEDICNMEYLMDTAVQAGWSVKLISMDSIGEVITPQGERFFIDEHQQPIELCFKLYPWEWMITSDYALSLAQSPTQWIEPAWKAVLSNKALLPVLWELFPGHPNLLEASFEEKHFKGRAYAKKPFFSREGCNVTLFTPEGPIAHHPGEYGSEGFIYQAYCPAPQHDHYHTTLGLWIVDDTPCGLCVREQNGLIAKNTSFFVPHYFADSIEGVKTS